jgi:RHS repeat-associated protein
MPTQETKAQKVGHPPASNSGSTLTGGHDTGATTYDSGTAWITVNGTQFSATYGQTSTASSLATTLANAVNTGSSVVTAAVSGSTINLTATTPGTGTNYSLSSGSSTNQPSSFSQASFTVSVSGSALTGGTTGGTSMYADTAYAPFGETYASSGTTDPAFTSQRQDTVSGLYDFPAREYSIQGRWPSPDPAGFLAADYTNPQTWNAYAYALNNPVNFIDPLGLFTCGSIWVSCNPPAPSGGSGGGSAGGSVGGTANDPGNLIFKGGSSGGGGGSSSTTKACVQPTTFQKIGIAGQAALAKLLDKTIGVGAGVSVAGAICSE